VCKSETIRIQVGNHNKLIMVAVYGTTCAIPASNSNIFNKGRPTGISLLVYILLDGKRITEQESGCISLRCTQEILSLNPIRDQLF
jgi:hypothetical protein